MSYAILDAPGAVVTTATLRARRRKGGPGAVFDPQHLAEGIPAGHPCAAAEAVAVTSGVCPSRTTSESVLKRDSSASNSARRRGRRSGRSAAGPDQLTCASVPMPGNETVCEKPPVGANAAPPAESPVTSPTGSAGKSGAASRGAPLLITGVPRTCPASSLAASNSASVWRARSSTTRTSSWRTSPRLRCPRSCARPATGAPAPVNRSRPSGLGVFDAVAVPLVLADRGIGPDGQGERAGLRSVVFMPGRCTTATGTGQSESRPLCLSVVIPVGSNHASSDAPKRSSGTTPRLASSRLL